MPQTKQPRLRDHLGPFVVDLVVAIALPLPTGFTTTIDHPGLDHLFSNYGHFHVLIDSPGTGYGESASTVQDPIKIFTTIHLQL